MYPVNSALLNAVGTLFLAEAGRIARERERQLFLGGHAVYKLADHGMLRGADEIKILALYLVHHGVHFLKAHNSGYYPASYHIGRNAVGKALVNHKIARVGKHRRMEPRYIAHEIVKALARDAAGGVLVYSVEKLHNIGMVGYFKIRVGLLPEFFHLYVLAVVLSDRHARVHDVRYLHLDFKHFRREPVLFFLKLLKLRRLLVHKPLHLLGFFLFALSHKHAYLLAYAVAVGAQVIGAVVGGAFLAVELYYLVYKRELSVLKFLFYIFLYKLWIFANKFNIKHYNSSGQAFKS